MNLNDERAFVKEKVQPQNHYTTNDIIKASFTAYYIKSPP